MMPAFVSGSMAVRAQCYQILLSVVANGTSRSDVVNLELIGGSAPLTLPSISFEDPPTECLVGVEVTSKSRTPW